MRYAGAAGGGVGVGAGAGVGADDPASALGAPGGMALPQMRVRRRGGNSTVAEAPKPVDEEMVRQFVAPSLDEMLVAAMAAREDAEGGFDQRNASAKHAELNSIGLESVGTEAAAALSKQAARESLVLLARGSLPWGRP